MHHFSNNLWNNDRRPQTHAVEIIQYQTTYGFEDCSIVLVGDAISERKIQRMPSAFTKSNVLNTKQLSHTLRPSSRSHHTHPNFTSSREIFSVLVEADGHYTVSCVKRFLHSVSVMHIDVDVKHALMISEEFQYAKNNVYEELRLEKPTNWSC